MLVAIPEAAKATLERLYREDAAQRAAGLPVIAAHPQHRPQ